MRILHLLNEIDIVGNGIVNAALDIACVQAHLGHQVAVASPSGGYKLLLEENGVRHYELLQSMRPIAFARAARGLALVLRDFRPEIVHCHMMRGMLLGRLLKRSGQYRLFSHIHNPHQRSSLMMGLADRAIAVSDAVARQMSRRGIPASKMLVVHNRTVGSFRQKVLPKEKPVNLQKPSIVCVAGMFKHKNIDGLIAAFDMLAAEYPQAHLYLVGDGPDIDEFKARAAETTAADRIHFEGFQANPQAYMRASEIFVLPSHTESFGLVLHEAREVGAAIVATNVGGVSEALDGGEAGLLVPPRNTIELSDAIRRLLADPSEVARWKAAAFSGIEKQTVWQMGERVTAAYEKLLSNSRSGQS